MNNRVRRHSSDLQNADITSAVVLMVVCFEFLYTNKWFLMPIQFDCSECGKAMQAPENLAGRRVRCPFCQMVVTVPQGESPEDDVYDAEEREPPRSRSSDRSDSRKKSSFREMDFGDMDGERAESRSRSRSRSDEDYDEEETPRRSAEKPCPACGEMVPKKALRCRFCDEPLGSRSRSSSMRGGSADDNNAMTFAIVAIVLAFCCALAGLIVGIIGLNKANESRADNAGAAKTLCIVAIILAALNMIAGVLIQMGGGFN
jgi:hypothetical protein